MNISAAQNMKMALQAVGAHRFRSLLEIGVSEPGVQDRPGFSLWIFDWGCGFLREAVCGRTDGQNKNGGAHTKVDCSSSRSWIA